ncbi:MAG: phosphoglycerate kinase [Candidatus Niyogibacteria bacterium]|nr:phosphoglycerate kinase [Candidatus Niyogibacteria bacterium]
MKEIMKLKPAALRGKTVLVRVDYNVPLVSGKVADDFRIRASLPLLRHLRKCGARAVLVGHLEVGGKTPSLRPVAAHLKKIGLKNLVFIPGQITPAIINAARAAKADVILLDNLRLDKGEVKNDKNYAKLLAACGDIYVNDAFSVSHRAHASVVGVPKFLPSYAGPLFMREVSALRKILRPPHPALAILGGNKISTKIAVIKSLLRNVDRIFVGGAMANIFIKLLGYEIGRSFIEAGSEKFARALLENKKIILPVDVIVESGGRWMNKKISEIGGEDKIYDMGPLTAAILNKEVARAKLTMWNGPLGWVEAGFTQGSLTVAKMLASAKGETIVGGGDTVAFLEHAKLAKKFDFVSTGGGAMLDFIANGTLPGIEVLK